jgi:hypothetical protein
VIRPLDPEELRLEVRVAAPFPHLLIDNFLEPHFARQVCESFPSFEEARKIGLAFRTVNEKAKVQITDEARFPEPVRELAGLLASDSWRDTVSSIFEIPNLLADDELLGGGMHQTGPRGRLDVHIDFNYIAERQLYRRLNILVFLNPDWKPEWGGFLELWDRDVQQCHRSFEPVFNRCVIFETSEISYHGVTAVTCPPGEARKSFAAYYYTRERPEHWSGEAHSTVFRSRPNEVVKGRVLMPAEKALRSASHSLTSLRRGIKRIIKGPPA